MVDDKVEHPGYYYLGGFLVSFILGFSLIIPVFDNKSGLDILGEMVSSVEEQVSPVADIDTPAYIYEHFVPPENSFGIGETTFKHVNWSYFKNLFRNNFQVSLEYRISDTWVENNDYLSTSFDWQDEGYWKINLSFTKPPSPMMDVRFTIGMNKNVIDYVEKAGQYEYWLNYSANNTEVYSCFFNWSDLMSIPGLVFNHGVTDGLFWFRFRKDDVPANTVEKVYVFDPIFGNTNEQALTATGRNYYRGVRASPGVNGIVTKISAYMTDVDTGEDICAVICEYNDGGADTRIGYSAEYDTLDGDDEWFDFDMDNIEITEDKTYCIAIYCKLDSYIYYDEVDTDNDWVRDYDSYNYPPDSSIDFQYEDTFTVSVYATYTATGAANTVSEITLNSPSNITGEISPVNLSITVSDDDGDVMNISWYGDGSLLTSYENCSNGTYGYDWTCTGGYHTWNVTVGDGSDDNDSDIRWFTIDYWNDTFVDTDNVSSTLNMTYTSGYYTTDSSSSGGASGSITVVSNTSAINDPATTVTITKPADVQDDDVLFVFLFHDNNDAGDEFNTLDGWVQIFNLTDDPSGRGGTTWYGYHIVTDSGSEPADYTFTHTDTTAEDTGGIMVCLRGVDTSDPLANDTGYTYSFQANTGDFLSPDITTDEDDALVLCIGSMSHSMSSCIPPTGTNLITFVDHDYCNLMMASYTQENSGATGDKEWDTDATQEARGGQVAFKPALVGGSTYYNCTLTTVNITKNSTADWDKIYATYNCSSSNFSIDILDNTTEDVILSGLDDDSDISSLTNDTVKLFFNITDNCNFSGFNISWTTTAANTAPSIDDTYPDNNSIGISINIPKFYFNASDADGDYMNCSNYMIIEGCNQNYVNEGAFLDSAIVMDVAPACLPLAYDTTYTWSINLSDDDTYTNETFTFTTEEAPYWNLEESWNFSFSNTSRNFEVTDMLWNFSFSNTSRNYENLNVLDWNFSFSNTSRSYHNTGLWNFSFSNSSRAIHPTSMLWNFSFSNSSRNIYPTDMLFNFSFSNTTKTYHNTGLWNFSFSNSSRAIHPTSMLWNFSFSNTSRSFYNIEQWNFSFSNTTESVREWNLTTSWNFSFSNSSRAIHPTSMLWNFSFSNTSRNFEVTDMLWNFSFSNTSRNYENLNVLDWNFSFSNTTTLVREWNLTASWNFSFSNTTRTFYGNNMLWNFSFSNTSTGATKIMITNENPNNGTSIPTTIPSIYFTLTVSDGSDVNYTIYWGESLDNLTSNISYGGLVSNGTYYTSFTNASSYTTYYWSVNCSDGTTWVNESYSFTARREGVILTGSDRSNTVYLAFFLLAIIPIIILFIRKKRKKDEEEW